MASGKSSLVEEYANRGYKPFNRDIFGGSLDNLANLVDTYLTSNLCGVVLDNTYGTVESRRSIIQVANKHRIPILCKWLTTSLEDSQLNSCLRSIKLTGKLTNDSGNKNPNLFPNSALFSYRKKFEAPSLKEGFTTIDKIPFIRTWTPEYKNKAIIFDYDGTLRASKGVNPWPEKVSDVEILPNRKDIILKWKRDGYILLGASNQSCISKGLDENVVIDCFKETNRQLGIDIEYLYCSHRVPPVSCYCRKPSVGMGALFIEKYKLNPSKCIMVGDMTTDETFASRCGFKYEHANKFFVNE